MLRSDILDEAKETAKCQKIGDGFKRTAHLWSEYLDKGISIQDVANMMILFKVANSVSDRLNVEEDYIDICMLSSIAGEMASINSVNVYEKEVFYNV